MSQKPDSRTLKLHSMNDTNSHVACEMSEMLTLQQPRASEACLALLPVDVVCPHVYKPSIKASRCTHKIGHKHREEGIIDIIKTDLLTCFASLIMRKTTVYGIGGFLSLYILLQICRCA